MSAILRILLGLVALLLPLVALADEPLAKRSVPARELPVPTTVSPGLQMLIAQPVPPLTAVPTTPEGWRALQREADTAAEMVARGAMSLLNVQIEPEKIAGVSCFRITPSQIAPENEHRLILHVHGGAFVFNAGMAGTSEGTLLAHATKTRVLSVDYRMPPDHPFPAAPDDVLAVWKHLSASSDPATIAMAGTSAGAGLIMTTMLRVKELGLPKPAALFIGTPASDLSKTGDSVFANAEIDNKLGRYEGRIKACLDLYAAGRDLKDPLISPIYGDLSGCPPTILISGTRDLLLSNTVRTHRKLRAAGVEAALHVYDGQSHADYLLSFPSPESLDALGEITRFFDRHLKK